MNFFALPEFDNKPQGKDIAALIKEDPIDLSPPGELINYSAASATVAPSSPVIEAEVVTQPAIVVEVASKQIQNNGMLSITDLEKLVTYLSSLTLMESKLEAIKWIFEAWNIAPDNLTDKEDFEILKEDNQLLQYEMNGTMKRLQSLNYPALLEIALPNAQGTKYLALSSIRGDKGVFGSVDKIEMPLSIINSIWTRKAIVLWKDFENLPDSFDLGFKGKEAVWLQKNLRLLGFFQGREAPLYGPKTIRAVRRLQRNNNIKDDGKFQIDSKMLVYNLLQIYQTPKLVTR